MDLAILTTDKQREAFLHPTRCKILEFLTHKPMTVSGVAKELKVHPANLTHHFKKLKSANLIKVTEERDTGRVIEIYYSAVAKGFEINQQTHGANSKVLTFLRNDLTATISALKPDDSEDIIGLIKRSRISTKAFKKFSAKLSDLIEEFTSANEDDGSTYALNVSLYPHSVHYGPLKKIHITKNEKDQK